MTITLSLIEDIIMCILRSNFSQIKFTNTVTWSYDIQGNFNANVDSANSSLARCKVPTSVHNYFNGMQFV